MISCHHNLLFWQLSLWEHIILLTNKKSWWISESWDEGWNPLVIGSNMGQRMVTRRNVSEKSSQFKQNCGQLNEVGVDMWLVVRVCIPDCFYSYSYKCHQSEVPSPTTFSNKWCSFCALQKTLIIHRKYFYTYLHTHTQKVASLVLYSAVTCERQVIFCFLSFLVFCCPFPYFFFLFHSALLHYGVQEREMALTSNFDIPGIFSLSFGAGEEGFFPFPIKRISELVR